MSLREKQQMNLDTERATHTGMECPSRSSPRYLVLQVWCGLLTVAMVVMAALLTSIKLKSTENGVSTLKPDVISTGALIRSNTSLAPYKAKGSSLSYIQLDTQDGRSWKISHRCDSCSLILHNNSIHCLMESLFVIYAQVTFSKHPEKNPNKSVILIKNASYGRRERPLVEGNIPNTVEGSVWVAKIVSLKKRESVRLDITGDFLKGSTSTFWGAYELH